MSKLKDVAYYVSTKMNVSDLIREEYISTDNMLTNRGGITTCASLPEASKVTQYGVGDILVSNIRPYFKKIWYSNRISGCSNDVLVFRTKDENIDPLFLYYVLSQDKFFDYMMAGANGTKMPRGNKKEILEFSIPEFEIQKQRRIVQILSAYDHLIENNQKQIKLLEEAAQRLYKEWFVDLRFPGYENTPIIDGVPQGWRKATLGDIAPILTGKKDANFGTEDGAYPFFTCSQEPIKAPSYSFDTNAVILAGNGDFNVKLYRGKFEAYQRTYVLSPDDEKYLYLLYNSVHESMAVLVKGASGSTIKFLTKGMIESIPLFVPTDELLTQYNDYSEAVQRKLECLKITIKNATEARDRLLPKLMSGELDLAETKKAEILQPLPKLSYDEFLSDLGMAARAKTVSEADLRAMYEAYLDDDAEDRD